MIRPSDACATDPLKGGSVGRTGGLPDAGAALQLRKVQDERLEEVMVRSIGSVLRSVERSVERMVTAGGDWFLLVAVSLLTLPVVLVGYCTALGYPLSRSRSCSLVVGWPARASSATCLRRSKGGAGRPSPKAVCSAFEVSGTSSSREHRLAPAEHQDLTSASTDRAGCVPIQVEWGGTAWGGRLRARMLRRFG